MTKNHPPTSPTASKGTSSSWQPSSLDVSSPTYSGSLTGQRPATNAQPTRRPYRTAPLATVAAAVLTVAVAAVLLLRSQNDLTPTLPPALGAESVAVLEIVRGAVTVLPAESATGESRLLTLDAGGALLAGTVIETGGTGGGKPATVALASVSGGDDASADSGRVAFRLASGPSVRLDTDSRVRLASSSTLVLERGSVYVDSAAGSGVEVRTTLGTVRDIGTQFEVRLMDDEASLRVRVREGTIVLQQEAGSPHQASAGGELSLHDDGSIVRGTSPVFGPHWDWVLETAPLPEIEGRSLRYFLDWAAREGGWTLRFADDATATLAAQIVLHGDVADLTPGEAVAMVFDGSGLDYALAEGTFFVSSGDNDVTRP